MAVNDSFYGEASLLFGERLGFEFSQDLLTGQQQLQAEQVDVAARSPLLANAVFADEIEIGVPNGAT